MRPLAVKT